MIGSRNVWLALVVLASACRASSAAVPAQEAARLKSDLTPLGGERAGNADGTIPRWEGGYTTPPPGYRSGQPRPDPFADEKPLFRIDARSMAKYEAQLTDGTKALLQRFPDYRLDVYPTHRTAAAPAWVYENTFKNATRAHTTNGGLAEEGGYGGIPFPIPRDGMEVMWNHILNWKGEAFALNYQVYVVVAGRAPVLATEIQQEFQFPYYYRDGSPERFRGIATLTKLTTTAPPFRAGEQIVVQEPIDLFREGRRAWQYLVGQRRVRRAPTIAYDNPNFVRSGFGFFDELFVFNGSLDRYTWKLLGKREMFIPYNTQRFHSGKIAEVLGPRHLNPDYERWERHRVWVVEATLAPGKRHQIPRRRFYVDEDTWCALLGDGWDARGQLWHISYALPILVPELPANVLLPHVMFDLQRDGYAADSLINETSRKFEVVPRRPDSDFTPEALVRQGVR
jgi:hypothetical protein